MKLRILNVLTKTAPTIPQTPHTDLKYPYVPKMAIRTHCVCVASSPLQRTGNWAWMKKIILHAGGEEKIANFGNLGKKNCKYEIKCY